MKIFVCIGQKKVYGLTEKDLVSYVQEKGYTPSIVYCIELNNQKLKEQLDSIELVDGENEQQ